MSLNCLSTQSGEAQEDNPWIEWLHNHLLTRSDGRWIADRRDAIPLERRSWVNEATTNDWPDQISNEDILDGLLFDHQGSTWLYTRGSWVDGDHYRKETFHITSALVSEATADSLLFALSTCKDNHDYRLPDYDDNMEIDEPPFVLKGWIQGGSTSPRLDKFDPHAANISYPSYTVSRPIVDQFSLTSDAEQREWFLPGFDKASIRSEVWSEKFPQDEDEVSRRGKRMSASLHFLRHLCQETKQALIIEVELKWESQNITKRRDYDGEGSKEVCKVYLLYRDGILRDTGSSYRLREKVGKGA